MENNHFPPVMTLEQAAEYLQITTEELQAELVAGQIPGRVIAGKWRISKETLDKLLDGNPVQSKPAVEPSAPAQPPPQPKKQAEPAPEAAKKTAPEKTKETPKPQKKEPAAEPAPVQELPSIAPGFVRGKVFAYNAKQGYGYARLFDNRVVWIDSQQLVDTSGYPFPGDLLEFKLAASGKVLKALSIKIIQKYDWNKKKVTKPLPPLPEVHPPSEAQKEAIEETKNRPPLALLDKTPATTPRPNPNIGTPESQQLYQKAALARTEGRFDDARRHFRQAIEAGAATQVYTTFIKFLIERNNNAEAVRLLEEAIGIFPDLAVFYNMYGQMERRARNYKKAEQIFRIGLGKITTLSKNHILRNGLAQTLVQIGTEESLAEAGKLYEALEKEGHLNTQDNSYQRFKIFKRNVRANRIFDFFQSAGMKVGIAARQRELVSYASELVVEIDNQEFRESFGINGIFIVRAYQKKPKQADLLDVIQFVRLAGGKEKISISGGMDVVIDPNLAFIAVEDTDAVRDQVMNILSQNNEAVIPIDDSEVATNKDPQIILRDLFGQYLGQRDLYNSAMPISGRGFFGREKLLTQLTDEINNGQFLGIYGLRKMGKTSLVYQLRDDKLSTEAVAYVDLQASPAIHLKSCLPIYYELERDLFVRMQRAGIDPNPILRLGKYSRYSDVPETGPQIALIFQEDIRMLLDMLSQGEVMGMHRLIIVMDELERILPVGGQPGCEGYLELFALLRGLAQTERYRGLLSSIVVAANSTISERGYWDERENPVFALYKPIFLSPFSEKECNEMIIALGKGMSVYWDDEAIHEVYLETAGHPFITRSLCSKIIKRNPTRPMTVNINMVQQEVASFIREEGKNLEQITELLRNNFPEEEKLLHQIAMDETPDRIPDESLKHLSDYKLIQPEGETYRVTMKLLNRWLRRQGGLRE